MILISFLYSSSFPSHNFEFLQKWLFKTKEKSKLLLLLTSFICLLLSFFLYRFIEKHSTINSVTVFDQNPSEKKSFSPATTSSTSSSFTPQIQSRSMSRNSSLKNVLQNVDRSPSPRRSAEHSLSTIRTDSPNGHQKSKLLNHNNNKNDDDMNIKSNKGIHSNNNSYFNDNHNNKNDNHNHNHTNIDNSNNNDNYYLSSSTNINNRNNSIVSTYSHATSTVPALVSGLKSRNTTPTPVPSRHTVPQLSGFEGPSSSSTHNSNYNNNLNSRNNITNSNRRNNILIDKKSNSNSNSYGNNSSQHHINGGAAVSGLGSKVKK